MVALIEVTITSLMKSPLIEVIVTSPINEQMVGAIITKLASITLVVDHIFRILAQNSKVSSQFLMSIVTIPTSIKQVNTPQETLFLIDRLA